MSTQSQLPRCRKEGIHLRSHILQGVNKLCSYCLSQIVNMQVWNKLLVTVVTTSLIYYQTCCKVVPTSPIQSWYNNIVTTLCRQPCNIIVISWLYADLLEQLCYKSDNAIKLVTSCEQLVSNLLQQLGTSNANTTCRQLVNRSVTINLFANLCVFTCVESMSSFTPFHLCFKKPYVLSYVLKITTNWQSF
jgi:hypothetical protein